MSVNMADITQSHVEEFKIKGFTKLDNFWTKEELTAIKDALYSLQKQGKLNNVATEDDGETHTEEDKNLQLCPLMPEHLLFESLPFIAKVGDAISKLILADEKESCCCYLSQTFWKPAKHGLGTGWHQDNAYFKLSDGKKGTAMWTAVHDATVENGTLHLMAGMDAEVLPHKRDLTSDHHISCKDSVKEEDAVPMKVPAGGVVFFNCNVPRCTKANETDNARAAVAYHFVSMEVARDRQFSLPEGAQYSAPGIWGPMADTEEVEGKQNIWKKLVS